MVEERLQDQLITNAQKKKEGNILYMESIQSSTTPYPGYHIDKTQENSQEISPFSAGGHKAVMNRQESITYTKHN